MASAFSGGNATVKNSEETNSWSVIPVLFFIFIGASAYAVYFIRHKKVISTPGHDFEILDE